MSEPFVARIRSERNTLEDFPENATRAKAPYESYNFSPIPPTWLLMFHSKLFLSFALALLIAGCGGGTGFQPTITGVKPETLQ